MASLRRVKVLLVLNLIAVAGFVLFLAKCRPISVRSGDAFHEIRPRAEAANLSAHSASPIQDAVLKRLSLLEDIVYRQLNAVSLLLLWKHVSTAGARVRESLPGDSSPSAETSRAAKWDWRRRPADLEEIALAAQRLRGQRGSQVALGLGDPEGVTVSALDSYDRQVRMELSDKWVGGSENPHSSFPFPTRRDLTVMVMVHPFVRVDGSLKAASSAEEVRCCQVQQCFSPLSTKMPFLKKATCHLRVPESEGVCLDVIA
ncbi:hypothetical protein PANDA_012204 [Ailuropoda melanoleuca]|uniref:Uncharacterized protein n=1 Tax=Ailuropoda melanoleuca TaxID=9646 RepID=D2HL70_AILME|nr:hypothetical protein PANDA_012204 [Ailuropoda melanoleuca]